MESKHRSLRRVYVAGAYSADNVIDVLNNMRRGMRLATEVALAGFSPWVPWFDYHFQLMLRDGENFDINFYYKYSMDWLEVSEAVVLVEGWKNSKGTLAEIERAKELQIPIFYSLAQFLQGQL